ncbi:DinB family protein [Amycolatopsis sp. AA4]|uniref:DinB family protein n=1 Tax=Actinomycetes TaxID=1760 RepID=UPI0001B539B9|nr:MULTISPECIES: DinB family protein [Actinomycetes]ATY09466.1 DinB family protein [Amycolatopsis sp. AA4]EFL04809.1 Azi37 [Streptomyces sp. AA4]
MTNDWTNELTEQLDWHWQHHVRPKLEGLTDDEYLWQPVADCWTVRPRTSENDPGTGDFTVDFSFPEPTPPPVTTIAWRLAHVIVGVLGMRSASHFGGPPMTYQDFPYAGSADEALKQLDDGYATWIAGVRSLDAEALARPCGPAEGPYAELTMAALVLHINREMIHHCAEVLLLRDLYRNR